MEKPTTSKSNNKLFKLLQKAIRNLPRRNKNLDYEGGQMVKNPSFEEPISPKISCIGQVKQRKKVAKNIHLFLHKEMCPVVASRNKGLLMKPTFFLHEGEKIPSNMRHTHSYNGVSKHKGGRKSSCALSEKGPCLDEMKRFPSCHGGELSEFDWKIAQMEVDDYMNEWKCSYSDSNEEEEEEEQEQEEQEEQGEQEEGVKVSFCGPLEPRKEVNLWRRRTIDQPTPLQIRSPCTPHTIHRYRGR